ncbi:hypothetical protein Ntsu_39220 [Nocardia sp. IFM 10818]
MQPIVWEAKTQRPPGIDCTRAATANGCGPTTRRSYPEHHGPRRTRRRDQRQEPVTTTSEPTGEHAHTRPIAAAEPGSPWYRPSFERI